MEQLPIEIEDIIFQYKHNLDWKDVMDELKEKVIRIYEFNDDRFFISSTLIFDFKKNVNYQYYNGSCGGNTFLRIYYPGTRKKSIIFKDY